MLAEKRTSDQVGGADVFASTFIIHAGKLDSPARYILCHARVDVQGTSTAALLMAMPLDHSRRPEARECFVAKEGPRSRGSRLMGQRRCVWERALHDFVVLEILRFGPAEFGGLGDDGLAERVLPESAC